MDNCKDSALKRFYLSPVQYEYFNFCFRILVKKVALEIDTFILNSYIWFEILQIVLN